jgi:hypothetical protein
LPEETKRLIVEYLFPKLKKLFTESTGTPVYILEKGKAFKTANLERVETSESSPPSTLSMFTSNGSRFEIECYVKPDAVAYMPQ